MGMRAGLVAMVAAAKVLLCGAPAQAAAKLVLVHCGGPMMARASEVVEGVAAVFPRDVVYGCGAYSALLSSAIFDRLRRDRFYLPRLTLSR